MLFVFRHGFSYSFINRSPPLILIVFLLVVCCFQIKPTNSSVVVLNVRNEASGDEFNICALKKPVNENNNNNNDDADSNKRFRLVNVQPYDGCSPYSSSKQQRPNVTSSALFMEIHEPFNCSFDNLVRNVQKASPSFAIVGSNGLIRINTSITMFNISFLFMPQDFADSLSDFMAKSLSSTTIVLLPITDRFDYSLIVIWLVALSTIFFGALWTKHEFRKTINRTKKAQNETDNNITSTTNDPTSSASTNGNNYHVLLSSNNNDESTNNLVKMEANAVNGDGTAAESSAPAAAVAVASKDSNKIKKQSKHDDKHILTLSIGYSSILVLLLIVVSMLLLLYFFYNIMIYFIFAIFGIGASSALYRIGCLFLEKFNYLTCRIPKNKLPMLKDQPEIRKMLLGSLCIAFSVVWFVYRHEKWSWIIQNIMAVSLAVNALSFYRISTYKSITILLSVFLFYDIFMVFITPTFTKGTSIMEAVAFGGKDSYNTSAVQDWSRIQFSPRVDRTNRLPVVIVIPHLEAKKRLCDYYFDYPFSLLGLGDILIPGLSINYGIIYDYADQNRFSVYFIANILAYLVGLIIAFVGLITMNKAQPALLYLCPLLLITSLLVALARKEFKRFWTGEPIHKLISSINPNENNNNINSNLSDVTKDIEGQ